MNREEIIRMAREAGYGEAMADLHAPALERFAALVAAAERYRPWTQEHWTDYDRSIAAAEREACAKVCEDLRHPHGYSAETVDWVDGADKCAEAIRARSQA